jgi:hypothetical protein
MNDETRSALDARPSTTRPLAYDVIEIESINTVGAVLLGILALVLLIALLRCQARNRALLAQLSQHTQ